MVSTPQILRIENMWITVSATLYRRLSELAAESDKTVEEYAAAIINSDGVRLPDLGQNNLSEEGIAIISLYEFCFRDCREQQRVLMSIKQS